jgi:hypothetical protein
MHAVNAVRVQIVVKFKHHQHAVQTYGHVGKKDVASPINPGVNELIQACEIATVETLGKRCRKEEKGVTLVKAWERVNCSSCCLS